MRKELESAAKEQEVAEKHLDEARKKAHKAEYVTKKTQAWIAPGLRF